MSIKSNFDKLGNETVVVECSRCRSLSTEHMNHDSIEQAFSRALKNGWVKYYPSVSSPASWLCRRCSGK